jgi:hypothetical protein
MCSDMNKSVIDSYRNYHCAIGQREVIITPRAERNRDTRLPGLSWSRRGHDSQSLRQRQPSSPFNFILHHLPLSWIPTYSLLSPNFFSVFVTPSPVPQDHHLLHTSVYPTTQRCQLLPPALLGPHPSIHTSNSRHHLLLLKKLYSTESLAEVMASSLSMSTCHFLQTLHSSFACHTFHFIVHLPPCFLPMLDLTIHHYNYLASSLLHEHHQAPDR